MSHDMLVTSTPHPIVAFISSHQNIRHDENSMCPFPKVSWSKLKQKQMARIYAFKSRRGKWIVYER